MQTRVNDTWTMRKLSALQKTLKILHHAKHWVNLQVIIFKQNHIFISTLNQLWMNLIFKCITKFFAIQEQKPSWTTTKYQYIKEKFFFNIDQHSQRVMSLYLPLCPVISPCLLHVNKMVLWSDTAFYSNTPVVEAIPFASPLHTALPMKTK